MANVMKIMNGGLIIRICLWAMFVAGLVIMVLDGITLVGVLVIVGILLMAIDYPKKETRNKK